MEWRYIDKSETALLRQAYEWESEFPIWYKDAGCIWTATLDEALAFYDRCTLYGLFEEGEFVGLIYMEQIPPNHLNIHLDLKRGVRIGPEIIEKVRDSEFRKGIRTGQVWVLRRNRAIRAVLKLAGFVETGLSMRQGESHGKVLKWDQLVVVRSF